MVQGRQQRHQVDTVAAFRDFNRQRALARRRQAGLGIEHRADAVGQAQALEAGGSEDDGGVFAAIELAQPGIEVAAQRLDDQVGEAGGDQRLAAQAAGADDRAVGQVGQGGVVVGDKGVARVFALEHRAHHEPFGQLHRHVLEAVHGQVGATFGHRHFEFFDEQTLAADLGQGAVEDLIAARRHSDNFDIALRI